MNGDGLVTRTTWSSASCIDSTKVFTAVPSPSFVQILWAGPCPSSEDWEVEYSDDWEVVCMGWMNGGVYIA